MEHWTFVCKDQIREWFLKFQLNKLYSDFRYETTYSLKQGHIVKFIIEKNKANCFLESFALITGDYAIFYNYLKNIEKDTLIMLKQARDKIILDERIANFKLEIDNLKIDTDINEILKWLTKNCLLIKEIKDIKYGNYQLIWNSNPVFVSSEPLIFTIDEIKNKEIINYLFKQEEIYWRQMLRNITDSIILLEDYIAKWK